MRLLPRFGLQDLYDGLSTKNENELVTTVSCFSNLCFDGTVNLTSFSSWTLILYFRLFVHY